MQQTSGLYEKKKEYLKISQSDFTKMINVG